MYRIQGSGHEMSVNRPPKKTAHVNSLVEGLEIFVVKCCGGECATPYGYRKVRNDLG